ncbi:MAG: hypothetical protein ACRESW_12330, partial [Nevskiales bacterium]
MFSLIPQEVEQHRARLWVGAFDAATADLQNLQLQVASRSPVALNGTWRHWQGGGRKLAYQRIVLDPLADNTVVPVQLLKNDGRVLASATTTTLPKQLGNPSSPFIVFLGSCFWVKNDAAGHVGRTYSRLPAAARPHIKI